MCGSHVCHFCCLARSFELAALLFWIQRWAARLRSAQPCDASDFESHNVTGCARAAHSPRAKILGMRGECHQELLFVAALQHTRAHGMWKRLGRAGCMRCKFDAPCALGFDACWIKLSCHPGGHTSLWPTSFWRIAALRCARVAFNGIASRSAASNRAARSL